MRFTGNIKAQKDGFEVVAMLQGIPTMGQAQEIGAWLHDAVEQYLASKGASLSIPSNQKKLICT